MVVWQLSSEGLSQPTTREKRLTDYAEHHCFAYAPSRKFLLTTCVLGLLVFAHPITRAQE
jgi:hypothetical protein